MDDQNLRSHRAQPEHKRTDWKIAIIHELRPIVAVAVIDCIGVTGILNGQNICNKSAPTLSISHEDFRARFDSIGQI